MAHCCRALAKRLSMRRRSAMLPAAFLVGGIEKAIST
jgi:hypothetical protein